MRWSLPRAPRFKPDERNLNDLPPKWGQFRLFGRRWASKSRRKRAHFGYPENIGTPHFEPFAGPWRPMVRTHIPCPPQENPPCSAKLALTLSTTIAIGSAALIPTSASAHMHGHHGHGHWRGGFAVGIVAPTTVGVRREESRLYAVWPPRSPHHSLQLTTVDGQKDSPGFGSEVGASLSARLAILLPRSGICYAAEDVDARHKGGSRQQAGPRPCCSKASRDPRSKPAAPVSLP